MSPLKNWVTQNNVLQSQKWVTQKMFHTWKIIQTSKMFHPWKNGSHLKKCVTVEKMGHS